jgi:hypothetical protein
LEVRASEWVSKNDDRRIVSHTRTTLGVNERVEQTIYDTVDGDAGMGWVKLDVGPVHLL